MRLGSAIVRRLLVQCFGFENAVQGFKCLYFSVQIGFCYETNAQNFRWLGCSPLVLDTSVEYGNSFKFKNEWKSYVTIEVSWFHHAFSVITIERFWPLICCCANSKCRNNISWVEEILKFQIGGLDRRSWGPSPWNLAFIPRILTIFSGHVRCKARNNWTDFTNVFQVKPGDAFRELSNILK